MIHRLPDGDLVLPESAIITEYLDETYPERPLRPREPALRAKLRLWSHFCDQALKPDLDLYKYEWDGLSSEARAALLARLQTHLARLESVLGSTPYILGAEFSLADIHLFPFIRQLSRSRPDFEHQLPAPRLMNWLQGILDRPSVKMALKKPEIVA